MDIDLKINRVPFSLGMLLNENILKKAGIREMNFFMRIIFPISRKSGDKIYWVKNPSLSCFRDEVTASANLDRHYGIDFMNATSAYLFYNKQSLRYIICQVIRSYTVAQEFNNDLRNIATKYLGDAQKKNLVSVPYGYKGKRIQHRIYLEYLWNSGDQMFLSELGKSGKNAFLHWKYIY